MLELQLQIMIILPMVLIIGGLFSFILMDTVIPRKQRAIMLTITGLVFSLLFQNIVEYKAQQMSMIWLRTLVSVYGYWVRPIILVLFINFIDTKKRHRAAWIMVCSNFLVYCYTFFTHLTFWFDEQDHFHRGPLGYTCHIISLILLLVLVKNTLHEFRRERSFEATIPIICGTLIIAATIVDVFVTERYMVTFLTITSIVSCVFFYMWINFQMMRRHERALLAEQRIQIMMSQIQPHFLFNTLSTIQALCRMDPDKAFDTLGKFGVYLRQNIESLNRTELIPIHEELQHTRVYAEIEMVRFPSIQVEYDIQDEDFLIPALTIQPLVENAIRHGVRIRKNGLVKVVTRKEKDKYIIEIIDNGKGFDEKTAIQMDPSHIGIRNVRERVEKMCGGKLLINSKLDEGTTVIIRIPQNYGGQKTGGTINSLNNTLKNIEKIN